MVSQPQFDVFLCHNSEDKEAVIKIAHRLESHEIKPWLDDWELQPGYPWQPELERQIENIKSAAVFVGRSGIGPWQADEIYGFLRQFKQRRCPVIPVLLSDAPAQPKLPIFLEGITWVDFRQQTPVYTDPWQKLIWGITGRKPERKRQSIPANVIQTDDLSSVKGVDYTRAKIEYLYFCQFRAECEHDVDELVRILGWHVKKITKIKKTSLPDLDVEMCVDLSLEEIQVAMREVEDGHVMLETVTLKYDYTGERTYSSATTINPNTEVQSDDLSSERGVDYRRLRDFLAAGKWQEADEETLAVMLKVSGREKEGYLILESINNFPCTDLRTIDQMWVKYSNGCFGFSVQRQIYLSVGGKADGKYYEPAWKKFGDRVGWRVQGNWIDYPVNFIFNTSAPKGYLPCGIGTGSRYSIFHIHMLAVSLFSRVET